MAGYDNKLGEWFKYVEKREQERKARKQSDPLSAAEQDSPLGETEAAVASAEVLEAVREAPASAVATVEIDDVVTLEPVEAPRAAEPETTREIPAPGPLFDDTEIPPVEDFLSFLSRSSEPAVERVEEVQEPKDQRLLGLSEGTGDPRPISSVPEPQVQAPPVEPEIEQAPVRLEPVPVAPAQVIVTTAPETGIPTKGSADAVVERMPHHLQVLFGEAGEEVAQNSYKTFKETRGELIQRLLDPSISLEEAARILNVCPTTVRRYTNRGILKHFRTAGNQRRFRLSDVLAFMESAQLGEQVPAGVE